MKLFRCFIVSLFVFFGATCFVFAEEEVQEGVADAVSSQSEDTQGAVETSPGNVTLDFKDADITNVLRILSYKSGINIVAGKDVSGPVTIRLTDVPWETALDVILRTYGYTYERDGNIIRVTTTENLEKEELITEVFSLDYAAAANVKSSIEEMVSNRGKVKFDERTNLLIVTDIGTNIHKIRKVIDRLDMQTRQVMIETKIVETTLGNSEKFGIDWQMKVVASGAKIPTTLPFHRMLDDEAQSYMPAPKPPESQTEYDADTGTTLVTQTVSEFPTASEGVPSFPYTGIDNFLFGTLDFSQFQAVMEILSTRGDTSIVSNPRIVVLENQNAVINVGQTLNIPTYERNSETGSMEITGYMEKDLGVLLKVTPHINTSGFVTLSLEPELSSLLRYDTLTAQIQVPVFSVRKAKTQLMIKDGHTIAIGGLISEREVDKISKIPLLGDLPLIGIPFKKIEKTKEKTDLIFFVTVRLIDPESQEALAAAK
ncbi:MAG: secretin and TonB N-terminal domain-containing protein [Candidatus Omnitrophica bacterium]|nr:secretin and TonB N-terminal domain-containing protein [Candidatus Omnitrophota bacterium]MBU1853397.1 secretin and TonB N-terminal domain-containing protein [Candidatus Omnitrophota bacterium]